MNIIKNAKVLGILFLFTFIFCLGTANAQYTVIQNLGTVINSTAGTSADETQYLDLDAIKNKLGCARIDSVVTAIYAENETDIDSLDIYRGFRGSANGVVESYYTTPTTATITINIADAATAYQVSRGATGASILTSALLSGWNYIKFVTRGATSGNDATDPNKGWLIHYVYYTK